MFDLSAQAYTQIGMKVELPIANKKGELDKTDEVSWKDFCVHVLWNAGNGMDLTAKLKQGILADKIAAMDPDKIELSAEQVTIIRKAIEAAAMDPWASYSIIKIIDPESLK